MTLKCVDDFSSIAIFEWKGGAHKSYHRTDSVFSIKSNHSERTRCRKENVFLLLLSIKSVWLIDWLICLEHYGKYSDVIVLFLFIFALNAEIAHNHWLLLFIYNEYNLFNFNRKWHQTEENEKQSIMYTQSWFTIDSDREHEATAWTL